MSLTYIMHNFSRLLTLLKLALTTSAIGLFFLLCFSISICIRAISLAWASARRASCCNCAWRAKKFSSRRSDSDWEELFLPVWGVEHCGEQVSIISYLTLNSGANFKEYLHFNGSVTSFSPPTLKIKWCNLSVSDSVPSWDLPLKGWPWQRCLQLLLYRQSLSPHSILSKPTLSLQCSLTLLIFCTGGRLITPPSIALSYSLCIKPFSSHSGNLGKGLFP